MRAVRLPFFSFLTVLTLLIRADAQTLYGITGAGNNGGTPSSLYQVDATTGASTIVGSTGLTGVTSMRFNPTNGVLYAVTTGDGGHTSNLYTLSTSTGQATLIGATGLTSGVPDMAFSSGGTLYAWSEQNDTLVQINLSTGAATDLGFGVDTGSTGLAYSPSGTLYLKSSQDFYTINVAGSSVTYSFSTGQSLSNMLAFNNAGVMYSGNRNGGGTDLYTIDTGNGNATLVGHSGPAFSAIAFSTSPIPEPSTYACLVGVGVLGYSMYRRRVTKGV